METACAKRFGAWWIKPLSSPCSDSMDPFSCHCDLFLPVYCFSATATFNLKTALFPAWHCPGVLSPHLLLTPCWLDGPAGLPGLILRGRLSQTSLSSSRVAAARRHRTAKSCTGRDTHAPLLGAPDGAVIPAPTARTVRLLSCFICHLPPACQWQ